MHSPAFACEIALGDTGSNAERNRDRRQPVRPCRGEMPAPKEAEIRTMKLSTSIVLPRKLLRSSGLGRRRLDTKERSQLLGLKNTALDGFKAVSSFIFIACETGNGATNKGSERRGRGKERRDVKFPNPMGVR